MIIEQFEIWIADLNSRQGTETGEKRPVLIVQSDLLNRVHPSTLICPITSKVLNDSNILRVHLNKGTASLVEDSDIMIDQIRAIDNVRLLEKIGNTPEDMHDLIRQNLRTVLDL